MTALDADTLRNLRNLVSQATGRHPLPWYGYRPYADSNSWTLARENRLGDTLLHEYNLMKSTDDWAPSDTTADLIVALVNAAPALLDAAEAVERAHALADGWSAEYGTTFHRDDVVDALRAALAPPPDRPDPLAYTTHDDYDDEPPNYTEDEEAQR